MEERYEEGLIKGSIDSIAIEKTEIILEQMKKCICKVFGDKIGTGFFCKILFQNKLIPVMITNYHVINDNYINNHKQIQISINEKKEIININNKSKIYSSKNNEFDIMIIKLNEEDNINEYLELDEKIFNNDSEVYNKTKYVYMLSFSSDVKPKISFGDLLKEKSRDFKIAYTCVSGLGSAGAPILDYYSNKVIGIHRAAMPKSNFKEIDYKFGIFLKCPLEELNKKN